MKKTLFTLALGMASSSVFAAPETGQINFYGTVYGGGTCPIEVVNPSGSVIPRVTLGNFTTGYFGASGTATPDVAFALRITPDTTCKLPPTNKTKVAFTPLGLVVGTNLYGLRSSGADGLGLVIRDRTGAKVDPNADSPDYDLYTDRPTDMIFYAAYESYKDKVTEGLAEAEVTFTVKLP